MKTLLTGVLLALGCLSAQAAFISPLDGSTTSPQVQLGPEWFSRFDANQITQAQFAALKSQPTVNLNLYAAASTIKVSYVGTGASRDSNLFLAGVGGLNTSAFWAPIYASGGTNNLSTYNPVTSSNLLFETRAGCSYQSAKAGNSCQVSEIGKTREISGLNKGEELDFGLQALSLVYDGIKLPDVNYFFAGEARNNTDKKGWDDSQIHAKLLDLGSGEYLVGFEDTWLGSGSTSDRDYNDMVFIFSGVSNIDPPSVPEPNSFALLLSGLGLLGLSLKAMKR